MGINSSVDAVFCRRICSLWTTQQVHAADKNSRREVRDRAAALTDAHLGPTKGASANTPSHVDRNGASVGDILRETVRRLNRRDPAAVD